MTLPYPLFTSTHVSITAADDEIVGLATAGRLGDDIAPQMNGPWTGVHGRPAG
jgi:hypothetical protein